MKAERLLVPRTLVRSTGALLMLAVFAWSGLSGSTARAADHAEELPFDEAKIFFELNDTDGDLGIHGKIDGGPWRHLKIEDPHGRIIMELKSRGRLWQQALTELFFESAEPTFAELAPADFFKRFPEGTYEVEGRSQDGKELESEVEVSHTMPAPHAPTVNNTPMATMLATEGIDRVKQEMAWDALSDGVKRVFLRLLSMDGEDNAIQLTTSLPDRCVVRGTFRQLQRMIANLLDNALKYTPAGEAVMVSVQANNGQVAIAVTDTGTGIAANDLPHVFKRFYRCDRSRARDGTGLGLSLVQAIAHAHGGQVHVTSQPGAGSVFTVTLPWPPVAPAGLPALRTQ